MQLGRHVGLGIDHHTNQDIVGAKSPSLMENTQKTVFPLS